MSTSTTFNMAAMAAQAKVASRAVAQLTTTQKNELLTDYQINSSRMTKICIPNHSLK